MVEIFTPYVNFYTFFLKNYMFLPKRRKKTSNFLHGVKKHDFLQCKADAIP